MHGSFQSAKEQNPQEKIKPSTKVEERGTMQLKYRLIRVAVTIKLTSSTTALRVASMRVRPSFSALTR